MHPRRGGLKFHDLNGVATTVSYRGRLSEILESQQRWPEGFVCPAWGHRVAWIIHRQDQHGIDLYGCQACRRQARVTAGTMFHRSQAPLPLWFWPIYLMAFDKRNVAALTLARDLRVAYHMTWLLHHKIQQAMVQRNEQYKLGGLMELGDAYFGGVPHGPGKRGRGTDQDPSRVGVSLDEQSHPQYGFLDKVPDLTQDTVTQGLPEQVEPQSTWRTDGAEVYAKAAKVLKATLDVTRSTGPQAAEIVHGVHVFIRHTQASLDGTYYGFERARRGLYFTEFVYQFTHRHFGSRLPERLLLACGTVHPPPYGT